MTRKKRDKQDEVSLFHPETTGAVVSTASETPKLAMIEISESYQTQTTRLVSGVCTVGGTVLYVVVKQFCRKAFMSGGECFSVIPIKDFGYSFASFKKMLCALLAMHEGVGCEKSTMARVRHHVGYSFAGAPIFYEYGQVFHPYRGSSSKLWAEYQSAIRERPRFAMYPYIEFTITRE